ncbi:MAG: hypothetical protein IKM32_02330 [Clostridia bacterium]|nr:hypothetical protein [Clostridia bacterium]
MKKFIRMFLCLFLMFSILAATTVVDSGAEVSTYVSLSRSEVETRARAMADMQWTVKANHQTTSYDDVTIPSFVLSADVGDVVTGIPYCWGGFHGLDTCGNYTRFSEIVLSSSQTAGNVNTSTGGHQSRTIGLDCSGFVSSAYGFTTRKSSSGLRSYGNSISYEELKPMDFICRPGEHVVLYLSQYTDSNGNIIYTIIDSSVETGKVAIRTKPKSYYTTRGYTCYTPWNPQCTYQTEYDSTYHYNECTDCGYEMRSAHTYAYSSNNKLTHIKRCSGCAYTVNESHTMMLNSNGQFYCKYCGYSDGTAINSNEHIEDN